jgi:hypothetical protein
MVFLLRIRLNCIESQANNDEWYHPTYLGDKKTSKSKESGSKKAGDSDAAAAAMSSVAVAMATGVAKQPALAGTLLGYALDKSEGSAAKGMLLRRTHST